MNITVNGKFFHNPKEAQNHAGTDGQVYTIYKTSVPDNPRRFIRPYNPLKVENNPYVIGYFAINNYSIDAEFSPAELPDDVKPLTTIRYSNTPADDGGYPKHDETITEKIERLKPTPEPEPETPNPKPEE